MLAFVFYAQNVAYFGIESHAQIICPGLYSKIYYRRLQVTGKRSVSNMLVKLQELKERRTSQKLIFLYKVVEGLVPAIELDDYLKKVRPKRSTTAK
jgi:hypothetical protein